MSPRQATMLSIGLPVFFFSTSYAASDSCWLRNDFSSEEVHHLRRLAAPQSGHFLRMFGRELRRDARRSALKVSW